MNAAVDEHEKVARPAPKSDGFTPAEDSLLISEVRSYENNFKRRERAKKIQFWETVRAVFVNHSYQPKGPEKLAAEDQSPYYKYAHSLSLMHFCLIFW